MFWSGVGGVVWGVRGGGGVVWEVRGGGVGGARAGVVV